MNPSPSPQSTYYLRWRGRQEGPLALAAIRTRLEAGEIGRLHEIQADGRWLTLDEFLRQTDDRQRAAREADARRAREDQERAEAAARESELEDARRENARLANELDAARREYTPRPNMAPAAGEMPATNRAVPPVVRDRGMSGMAIAAFVLALLNFAPSLSSLAPMKGTYLPFVLVLSFVSTVLPIVFGHVALGTIRRTPGLRGRGLALSALWITYVLIGLGFLFGFVLAVNLGLLRH